VYDVTRKACVLTRQWLLHFSKKSGLLKYTHEINNWGSELTVEAWLYPEVILESSYVSIYKQGNLEFMLGREKFKFQDSGTELALPEEFPLLKWSHLAFSLDSSGYIVCKNDICTEATGITGGILLPNPGEIILLGTYASGKNFIGYATNFRIWKKKRTADDIKAFYGRRVQDIGDSNLIFNLGFNEKDNRALFIKNKFYESMAPDSNALDWQDDLDWHVEVQPVPLCERQCYFDGVNCRCNFYI